MNRHSLTYIDMHPEPVKRDWVGEILGWLAAAAVAAAGTFVLICLMVLPQLFRQ